MDVWSNFRYQIAKEKNIAEAKKQQAANPYNALVNKDVFGPVNTDVRNQFTGIANEARDRVAGVDQREARAGQTSLAQALQAQADGQGPSVAQSQLKQATDRNLAQTLALAASQRGGSTAANARNLMRNQAATNQDLARQSAELRMQEQMQARQQLADILNQQRAQDISAVSSADQTRLGSLAGAAGLTQADRDALIKREEMQLDYRMGKEGLRAREKEANRNREASVVGGVIGGIGAAIGLSDEDKKEKVGDGKKDTKSFLNRLSAGFEEFGSHLTGEKDPTGLIRLGQGIGKRLSRPKNTADESLGAGSFISPMGTDYIMPEFSDERLKRDIKDGSPISDDFLSKLEAKTYEYKDKKNGEGKHLGVMAQDLEKTEIGKSMVVDTPEGKMVDYGKGFGAILAAQAELHKRLKALEKSKGKK